MPKKINVQFFFFSYPKSHKINLFQTRYLQWSWVTMNKCIYVVTNPLPRYQNSPSCNNISNIAAAAAVSKVSSQLVFHLLQRQGKSRFIT